MVLRSIGATRAISDGKAVRARARPGPRWPAMDTMDAIGLGVAVLLTVYLFVALLRPESFE